MLMSHARGLALCIAALAVVLGASTAHAQQRGPGSLISTPRTDQPGVQRFAGQIVALPGPTASPTGITVQLQDARTVTIHLVPKTVLRARSAEAQVEGLSLGDFAVVDAVRVGPDWNARRVLFDVDPFGPIRLFTVSGTVVRLSRAGDRVLVSLVGGTTRWIFLTHDTRYALDGIPTDTVPVLQRNNVVQVDVRLAPRGWVALAINIKSARSAVLSH
jgi:hypothetical protein